MKFAIIGLGGPNTWSTKIKKALEKLGHSVYFLNNAEIKNRYCVSSFKKLYHQNQKYPFDLREILPVDRYDMIIISQTYFVFNNPNIGSTKVLYYHRELLSYPSCMNPNILAFNLPVHDRYIWHYYPQLYYSGKIIEIPVAVDPEEFNCNREKDLTGLNYVSVYANVMAESRDIFWNYVNEEFLSREKAFCSNGVRINGKKYVEFKEYKDYLERSEAFLLFTASGLFTSRRLMECAITKTFPVIHTENQESEKYHNDLGFEHNINCWMFNGGLEVPTLKGSELYENGIEDNYHNVLDNHTYKNRAKQILELLQ